MINLFQRLFPLKFDTPRNRFFLNHNIEPFKSRSCLPGSNSSYLQIRQRSPGPPDQQPNWTSLEPSSTPRRYQWTESNFKSSLTGLRPGSSNFQPNGTSFWPIANPRPSRSNHLRSNANHWWPSSTSFKPSQPNIQPDLVNNRFSDGGSVRP